MTMRTLLATLVIGVVLAVSGCGSSESSAGGSPDETVSDTPGAGAGADPGEGDPLPDTRGDDPFYLDSVSVRVAESDPVQLFLEVAGSAPTPCHQVAYEVTQASKELDVTITTVPSGEMCAQVLDPREVVLALGTSELPVTVRVNDEFVETVQP
jgi:hypothetical protein